MPTLTIKNIPQDLYERLKENAAKSRRSLNREIIFCLEQALGGRRVDPDDFLARIRVLREEIALPPLTDEFLAEARNDGRP